MVAKLIHIVLKNSAEEDSLFTSKVVKRNGKKSKLGNLKNNKSLSPNYLMNSAQYSQFILFQNKFIESDDDLRSYGND